MSVRAPGYLLVSLLYSSPFIARAVKFTFPSFTATRNATSALPSCVSFFTCVLHEVGELVERHRVFADLAAGLDERVVQLVELVHLLERIA